MEAVRIGDWCTLYHADATDILDTLREHEPDAVIMDPPYGLKLTGLGESANKPHSKLKRPRFRGDDEAANIGVWMDFPQVLLWGADHLRGQLPAGGRFLAWDKLAGLQPWDSFSDVEFAWHSRKGASRGISQRWKGLIGLGVDGEDKTREHPTQKPIRVMQWCIRECRLEPGATILDPYMGSGTTAIAAFGMDMRFVGVEIERRWFDAACERITRQCDAGLFGA